MEIYPFRAIGLGVNPNYENFKNKTTLDNELRNFGLAREEMKSSFELSIVDSSPIIMKPHWIGRYQLQYG